MAPLADVTGQITVESQRDTDFDFGVFSHDKSKPVGQSLSVTAPLLCDKIKSVSVKAHRMMLMCLF